VKKILFVLWSVSGIWGSGKFFFPEFALELLPGKPCGEFPPYFGGRERIFRILERIFGLPFLRHFYMIPLLKHVFPSAEG
jgi:hypothetical protein